MQEMWYETPAKDCSNLQGGCDPQVENLLYRCPKEWKRQETIYSMYTKTLFHNFSFSSYLPQSYEYKVGRTHDLDHTNTSNF